MLCRFPAELCLSPFPLRSGAPGDCGTPLGFATHRPYTTQGPPCGDPGLRCGTASRFTRHQGRDLARHNVPRVGQLVVNGVGQGPNHHHALKSVLRLFNRYPRAPIGRVPLQSPRTHCRSVRRDARRQRPPGAMVAGPGAWLQEPEQTPAPSTGKRPRRRASRRRDRWPVPARVQAHPGRGSGIAVKRVRPC